METGEASWSMVVTFFHPGMPGAPLIRAFPDEWVRHTVTETGITVKKPGAPPFVGFERWDSTELDPTGFLTYLPSRVPHLSWVSKGGIPQNSTSRDLDFAFQPGAPPFVGFERWDSTELDLI